MNFQDKGTWGHEYLYNIIDPTTGLGVLQFYLQNRKKISAKCLL